MRQRLVALLVATFGFPLLFLLAETIAWAVRSPTVVDTLLKYMPELVTLLFVLWFVAIAYTTVRVVWLATARIEPWFMRSGARAAGVFTLTIGLFLAGGFVISTWLPVVTVRVVPPDQQVGK